PAGQQRRVGVQGRLRAAARAGLGLARRPPNDFVPTLRRLPAGPGWRRGHGLWSSVPVSGPLVTDPLVAPALPGLGPEPPVPYAKETEPDGRLDEACARPG